MNNLEKAKEIIKENIKNARCGIFDCGNLFGDHLSCLYNRDGLEILICYYWEYFEVFGLSDEDFLKLEVYYNELLEGNSNG